MKYLFSNSLFSYKGVLPKQKFVSNSNFARLNECFVSIDMFLVKFARFGNIF